MPLEVKQEQNIGTKVAMLGHVCQFFMTKRHNSLVLKVKKWIERLDSIRIWSRLLDAYKLMYFDRNINGNKDGKILEGNEVLCN